MKRALIVVGVVVFFGVSLLVARWLNTDTVERGAVVELLRAQARGDARAMLERLDCRDEACRATARHNARRLRARGELKVVLYQSGTAHALGSRTKPTRVVWITPGRLTTVQCVVVRRKGNAIAGSSVRLLRLSTPIGRESSCR
ncbi:MAG: hypothetical protein M3401_03400 [Actinomycetota bacterium]|nr:hypothetical protein [Actinomycetota bacterium]